MLEMPIVVGIDGGPASIAALQVALKEAELRRIGVLAITCWPADGRRDDSSPLPCQNREQATEILEHVIAEATHHSKDHAPIVREVSQGPAGPTLVAATRKAELLVVGSTERGARTRQTVEHCLRNSVVPVLVVPWTVAALDEQDIELDLSQASIAR